MEHIQDTLEPHRPRVSCISSADIEQTRAQDADVVRNYLNNPQGVILVSSQCPDSFKDSEGA